MNSKLAAVLATGVAIAVPVLTAAQTPAPGQSAQTTLVLTEADSAYTPTADPSIARLKRLAAHDATDTLTGASACSTSTSVVTGAEESAPAFTVSVAR